MSDLALPPFFTIPPQSTDNLFLGLFPPPDVAASVDRLARQLRVKHGLSGRHLANERLHVSLCSFDPIEADLATICKVAATAAASTTSFKANFDRALSFRGKPSNCPFVLRDSGGNTALLDFYRHLRAALAKGGLFSARGTSFTPHITLLYDEKIVPEVEIKPVSWRVHEFVFVHSLVGRSRYIRLGCWSFQR